ncbi:hypothetical protein QQP08_020123 [Theobroma cacao]|nr:hypothetical protein QQP08_020123 [Theobroma cacao]
MEPYKLQSLLGAAHSGSILYLNREDMRRAKVSGIESMLVFISKGLREGRAVVVGRVVRAQSATTFQLNSDSWVLEASVTLFMVFKVEAFEEYFKAKDTSFNVFIFNYKNLASGDHQIFQWQYGIRRVSMASDAPSWADQWGAGGIGAMEDEDATAKKENGSKKKSEGKGGFNKAKTAALMGAKKFKLGVSKGITWVKNKCQKKGSSK